MSEPVVQVIFVQSGSSIPKVCKTCGKEIACNEKYYVFEVEYSSEGTVVVQKEVTCEECKTKWTERRKDERLNLEEL